MPKQTLSMDTNDLEMLGAETIFSKTTTGITLQSQSYESCDKLLLWQDIRLM